MPIDPVLVLAEEIRAAEAALRAAHISAGGEYPSEQANGIATLLSKVVSLHGRLFDTTPTSVLGAGELIRFAALRLPFSHANHIAHLHEIADRLGAGQRTYADLIWLRAITEDLSDAMRGENGSKAVLLLRLAITGASRPIMIFRAAETASAAVPPVCLDGTGETNRINEDRVSWE